MEWFKKKTEAPQKSVQEEMIEREIAAQEALLEEYSAKRRATDNDLENSKERVRKIETALYLKRDEYEKSTGNVQRIVAEEIKGLAKSLERQRGEQNNVLERLNQYDAIVAKCREAIQGLRAAGIAKGAEEVTTVLGEVEEQRARNEAAIRSLENVGRARQKIEDDFNVDALFTRLELETGMRPPLKKDEKDDLAKIDEFIAQATGKPTLETV